jgi:hypothetical protein
VADRDLFVQLVAAVDQQHEVKTDGCHTLAETMKWKGLA